MVPVLIAMFPWIATLRGPVQTVTSVRNDHTELGCRALNAVVPARPGTGRHLTDRRPGSVVSADQFVVLQERLGHVFGLFAVDVDLGVERPHRLIVERLGHRAEEGSELLDALHSLGHVQ